MQDLSGNLSQDEPKVPKKAKFISPKAHNISTSINLSHKSKKTAIKEKERKRNI